MTKNPPGRACVFDNPMPASIAAGMLESEGIISMLTNTEFSSIYPLGNPAISGVRMMVYESDLPRALDLLRAHGDLNE